MNNTKRLLACVMSVALLVSMLSCFGFATDVNTASAMVTGIDISGTGVGAAPTTDMAEFNALADDVLIIDSSISVNDETYSLVWNNEQTDDIPVKGKVFKSFYAAQYYATVNGITNPKIVVKKLDSNLEQIDITMEMSIYSQAYNTLPFIVGENSLDRWTYNKDDSAYDDYDSLTYKLPTIVIGEKVTGKVGIYGFTLGGAIVNTDRNGALDIEIVNTVVDNDAKVIVDLESEVLEATNSDSLVIKNMFVKKTGSYAKLLSNYVPTELIIDGLFVDAAVNPLETKTSVRQVGLKSKLVVKNSYFGDTELVFTLAGEPEEKMERSAIKTVELKNNIFNGLLDAATPLVFTMVPSNYTALTFSNNYVACKNGTASLVASAEAASSYNTTKLEVEIRENIMNGVRNDFALSNGVTGLRNCKMDIADNFNTPEYADSLEDVQGGEFNATEHGAFCKSYYADYKMTEKCNGAVAISSASATNGDVFVNNSTNTIYYIMNSGDATELVLEFGNPLTEYSWFEDETCAKEVAAADINMTAQNNIFYLRSEYENTEGTFYSDPYKVLVVRETPTIPYFTKAYTDPHGLISKNALFCDISCGWVTDGSLYEVEWQGEAYTFIKGVNLFESVEAAITFAKSNQIADPEFILMDMNGAHVYASRWLPSYPGKYFTVNYATKPYIGAPGVPAEDWTSNVGNGVGQYNVDAGITTSGINISGNEIAGNYEFYGFTLKASTIITDSRSSNRPGCVNIHLENCYFDVTAWSWALFSAADAAPTTTNPTEDFLYIKDSYLDSHGTGYRLFSGWQASDITFDGVFMNVGAFAGAQDFIKQNTSTASFRIINSHIKNFATILYNQGNNGEIKAGENKTFEISNNIFNNARLGASSAIAAYTKTWNKILINNNIFINESVEKFDMFKVLSGATASGNPCLLEVTGNKAYNMLGTFDFGSRAITSDSKVENNYVTPVHYQGGDVDTYGGIKLTATNGTVTLKTGDYWVDSDMTLRPDAIVDDYGFKGVNVVFNKEAKTVKYITLTTGEVGVIEEQTNKGYEYKINLAHIVDNKYGNKMTVIDSLDNKNKADINSDLVVKSDTELDTINLTVEVSSPDGSAKAEAYAVTITNEGPAIEGVTVGDTVAELKDGALYVELSGRGMDEAVTVTAKYPESTTEITKNGNVVTTVDTPNGTTETYEIALTYGGETVKANLFVTRRGAEFDEFDRVYKLADGVDDSDFLPGFKGAFQSLRAKMSALDRENAIQSEVDLMTSQMETLINESVKYDEFNVTVKEAKKIKNTDGKYCVPKYQALLDAIDNVYDSISQISDRESYDALMKTLSDAVDGLTGHVFGDYIHDTGSETCVDNGTKSSKCSTDGCDAKKTIAEKENYATGIHSFKEYVYNEDATHLSDGTQTATCEHCKKAVDTKVAPDTKLTIINSSTVFADVNEDDWFKDEVDYVATYKFMNGTSTTTFAPADTLTRAQFVMILANISGVDIKAAVEEIKFTDVNKDEWYAAAVKWASDNKIVSGTSETTFAPNATITREQMCVMLVNYAKFAGITLEKVTDKVDFADSAKIGSWSKDAVEACQRAGIISGVKEGAQTFFNPTGTATRSQAAVVIKIFHENYILA